MLQRLGKISTSKAVTEKRWATGLIFVTQVKNKTTRAAAAPKKRKKKSPASRKSGNGKHNQRDVQRRAAADGSGV